jgi:hypothetical protein
VHELPAAPLRPETRERIEAVLNCEVQNTPWAWRFIVPHPNLIALFILDPIATAFRGVIINRVQN